VWSKLKILYAFSQYKKRVESQFSENGEIGNLSLLAAVLQNWQTILINTY
jgi:hypothetical protein